MNSSGEKNVSRPSEGELSSHKHKKINPDDPTDSAAAERGNGDDGPVRISREDAEKNLPPDADPDDPVSP
jgi:hypothetical protein